MKVIFLLLKIILFPLYGLYYAVIFLRNWLFDVGIMKSVLPKVLTINVGNLSLGGTGKTPHVEYLVRLLSDNYKTSTLSRGYGRKTKGFLWADNHASAESIGDEPMQYYLKFKDKINIAVCENRVEGVEEIGQKFGDNQLIILDDAFQHRKISPYFNLLLSEYKKPFYDDALVPFGRLRDIRRSAKRADAVMITKCPGQLTEEEKEKIRTKISVYTKADVPVFFSKICYQKIIGYTETVVFDEKQNIGWWMTSALESNIGLNAIAQFTAEYKNQLPQGLGTGSLYHNNIASPLLVENGKLHYQSNIEWDLSLIQNL